MYQEPEKVRLGRTHVTRTAGRITFIDTEGSKRIIDGTDLENVNRLIDAARLGSAEEHRTTIVHVPYTPNGPGSENVVERPAIRMKPWHEVSAVVASRGDPDA